MSDEKPQSSEKLELTAEELAELVEAEAKAAAARLAAARSAIEAKVEKEYQTAAAQVVAVKPGPVLTDKRSQERIFRRELGEPEFFRYKKDLVPLRPILTDEEQEEISKMVEIPADKTAPYKPDHILSPEYGGISNYESGVTSMIDEARQKLSRLKNTPNVNPETISQAEQDLKTLDSLYQNYYFGMNVFRSARGGREKIKE